MWQPLKIENETKNALIEERGGVAVGEEKFALYLTARKLLVEEVLDEIKTIEPTLTDHGPRHIANVLQNVELILGEDLKKLSGTELYCLILSVLFHDTGNIKGRKDHQHKISTIYDFVRTDKKRFKQEKIIVMQIVAAHAGDAHDKTKDTLKFLGSSHLDSKPVNLRHIAAILRFADELAEGPHRTSNFMQEIGYLDGSKIYHDYANVISLCIDRSAKRIAIDYNITVNTNSDGSISDKDSFRKLVEFVYVRILKLDQERKYAKHYCPFLESFKEVSVVINFWEKDELVSVGLKPLILTDLVVPGDRSKTIPDYDSSYSVDSIINTLEAKHD